MNYTMEQVKQGIAAYIDNEFMPEVKEGSIKKVLIGAGIGIAIQRYSAIVDLYRENEFVKALGIFDSNGSIDVDTALAAIKQNIPTDGVKIEIPTMGLLTLTAEDADKLKTYISQTAK